MSGLIAAGLIYGFFVACGLIAAIVVEVRMRLAHHDPPVEEEPMGVLLRPYVPLWQQRRRPYDHEERGDFNGDH